MNKQKVISQELITVETNLMFTYFGSNVEKKIYHINSYKVKNYVCSTLLKSKTK